MALAEEIPLKRILPEIKQVEQRAWEQRHGPLDSPQKVAAFRSFLRGRVEGLRRYTFKLVNLLDPELEGLMKAYLEVFKGKPGYPHDEAGVRRAVGAPMGYHGRVHRVVAVHFKDGVVGFGIGHQFATYLDKRLWPHKLELVKALHAAVPDVHKQYYLAALGVRASHRRKGLAEALTLFRAALAEKAGFPGLLSRTENPDQERHFEKQGFHRVARHERYAYYHRAL